MNKYTQSDIYNHHNKGEATLRFLPNVLKDDYLSLEERVTHFSAYESFIEVKDINRHIDGIYKPGELPIAQIYSYLLNMGKDISIFDKIKMEYKYYSYVLVIDDPYNPELNGKVMLFEYDGDFYKTIMSYTTMLRIIIFDFQSGKNFTFSKYRKEKKAIFVKGISSIYDIIDFESEQAVFDFIDDRECDIFKMKFDHKPFEFEKVVKALS